MRENGDNYLTHRGSFKVYCNGVEVSISPYRTEFDEEEQKVENVIKDPRFILKDVSDQLSNTREKYIDLVNLEAMSTLKSLVVVVDHENSEYGDIVTVIAKSKSNEKGGTIYDRGSTTN
ncbi:hypothetical protein EPH95_03580 [Salicibibacter halophilus]|uniref:Uncharacterized protein n=1 Tax=Salicibibacter halophilus TaxID=2502791 RepID=A0A514LGH2_9BACI|nr:hypothetical protein [Salicibibacter halophilus]QDI90371.1 hypothetical protein EPH95_03580 [Salicibibacter halophilus]